MEIRQLRLFVVLLFIFQFSAATDVLAQLKAYPPHWFKNTKNQNLEILLHNPSGFSQPPVIE
jgi:hypothetical protein